MRYVVIGDIGWDTILTLDEQVADLCRVTGDELRLAVGQKVPATASHQTIGGNAANVAVALDRLGNEVQLISHVGDDWSGQQIKQQLQAEGLSVSGVTRSDHSSNHSTVLLCEGERTIISYHTVGAYQLGRQRADDWLILCSMGEKGPETLKKALSLDRPLVYLPGTRQVYGAQSLNRRVMKRSELIVVNEEEAQVLLDTRVKDPVILARRLLDVGVREAVVTNGRHGAVAAHASGVWRGSVWHGAPRVDPTGAGDAFAATYLWSRLSGSLIPDALRQAAVNAGSVVSEFGSTTGLLKRTTIARLLKTEQISTRKESYERK